MGLPSRRCQIQRGTDVKLSRPDWYRRPKSRLRCQSQTSGPSLKTERLDPVTRPKVWTESQDQTFGLSLKTKRSDSGLKVRIFYFDMEVKISISVCLRTQTFGHSLHLGLDSMASGSECWPQTRHRQAASSRLLLSFSLYLSNTLRYRPNQVTRASSTFSTLSILRCHGVVSVAYTEEHRCRHCERKNSMCSKPSSPFNPTHYVVLYPEKYNTKGGSVADWSCIRRQ